ncbi:MAG TPA: hypothetical protein VKI99_02935 [Candidatus Dormibacteraeota bacterium]|nr:hypothetical protein [Candidatus Dormibacteraeota bacterium]
MASRLSERRHQLLALAAIILLALVLLLVVGLRGGLFRLGEASSQGSTGGDGSSVTGGFSADASVGTGVPDTLDAGSGYQAIYSGQISSGQTAAGPTGGGTSGSTSAVAQPSGPQTTGSPGSGTSSAGTGDQSAGSGVGNPGGSPTLGGGQTSEGIATPELPSALLFVLGLISVAGVAWLFTRRRNALGHS